MTLFDKSFLEMLNLDQAALFDALFSANICPVFITEALADLSKSPPGVRSVEQIVRDLARKTPSMHSSPNMEFSAICLAELAGHRIEMRGVPARGRGRPVEHNGRFGLIYDEPEEAKAFHRWQDEEFYALEREFAQRWRDTVHGADYRELAKVARLALKINQRPKNWSDAYAIAAQAVDQDGQRFQQLQVAFGLLGLPGWMFRPIHERWIASGRPMLRQFAPYTAYCLHVELFFHVCIEKTLISPDRPSNRVDIAYLFYLPFCQIFVSQDRLHRSTAPLFMNERQQFVFGEELKADLVKLDNYYSALPEDQRAEGLFRLANSPPDDDAFLTTRLWRAAGFRQRPLSARPAKHKADAKQLIEQIRAMNRRPTLAPPSTAGLSMQDFDQMLIKRRIPRRMGKWTLIPDSVKDFPSD